MNMRRNTELRKEKKFPHEIESVRQRRAALVVKMMISIHRLPARRRFFLFFSFVFCFFFCFN